MARWTAVAGVAIVVTLVSAPVITGGLRGGDRADGGTPSQAGIATTTTRPRVRPVDATLAAPPRDPFPAPVSPVVVPRAGGSVLVDVETDESATVHQCIAAPALIATCAPGVPAVPGDLPALALVVVTPSFTDLAGRVHHCDRQACAVLAWAGDGELIGGRPLAFGQAAPEPRVQLRPAAGLVPGQRVTVSVTGLPPKSSGIVAVCVVRERRAAPACDRAGGVAFTADRHGEAIVAVRADCDRRHPCAVGVVDAPVVAPFAVLRFAGPPGADLPARRVVGGLGAAAALAAGAIVLARRTDWAPAGGDPFAGVDLGPDPFADVEITDVDW